MASQVGRLFRSKLPSERRRSDESCDLDSSGSSLSVDEESPVETQSEALPVSLKCSKNVVDSKRESNDNAKEWDVQEVKEWAKSMFNEEVAEKFEREEIDGTTLQSERILSDESMNSLGLSTIGKKDKFVVAVKKLFGKALEETHASSKRSRLQPLICFEEMDRVLSNKEKDQLTSMDRSIYNTKKKKIITFTKTVWPEDQPAPWFRGNNKNTKKLLETVEQLGQDETYTFSKGGLGPKAIEEIIRKHMQERRRKENDPILSEGSASDSNGSVTPRSQQQEKLKSYEAYFIDDLSFLSASAVLLVWFNKNCTSEIRLDDLKKQAKEMGLSLLRNKDKNTFIKAVASALIKEKKVVLTQSDYTKVTQDDVKIAPGN